MKTSDVCKLSNVSRSQIDQWIMRGIFVPENKTQKGHARNFTNKDLLMIITANEIRKLKINISTAFKYATCLNGKTINDNDIIIANDKKYVLANENEIISVIEMEGFEYFVLIHIGNILKNIFSSESYKNIINEY